MCDLFDNLAEEAEGLEGDWAGSAIFLDRVRDKGGIKVLSQLEVLRDSYELCLAKEESISLHEKQQGFYIDDEIENPLFFGEHSPNSSPKFSASTCGQHPNKETTYLSTVASISHLDEELISDEELNLSTLRSARENAGSTWPEATREAEALVSLNNSCHSSSYNAFMKESKLYKGSSSRAKSKPKFIFHSHIYSEELSLVVNNGNERTSSYDIPQADETGAAADGHIRKLITEYPLNVHEKESKKLEKITVASEIGHKHDLKRHSVAEFLDCFRNRNDCPQESSELMVLNFNGARLGDRNLDDGELPEALNSSFYCDDEENPQGLKSNLPGKTMVDQLHDAFGTVPAIDEIPPSAFHRTSGNIHQKLQRVMQSEKDRDVDYLNNMCPETSFNDTRSVSVKILSKFLEAKLIVCSCTPVGDGKVYLLSE